MFMRALLRWALLAAAIGLAAALLPGVHINGGVLSLLWIAALFALVNLTIGTLVRILTAPLILITLGLLTVVINAGMFWLTDRWSDSLTVDGFLWDVVAAVVVTVLTAILFFLFRDPLTPKARQA